MSEQQDSAKDSEQQPKKGGFVAQYRSGPIPPPQDLAAYEEIHPGLADRLVKMAEGHGKHRWWMEKGILAVDAWRIIAGQVLGFALAVLGVWAGVHLILNDKELWGLVAMLTPLGAIVGAFLYTRTKAK